MAPARIIALGDCYPCGCYVLRIHLTTSARIPFGGFKKGKLIDLRAGAYAYIGSATWEAAGDVAFSAELAALVRTAFGASNRRLAVRGGLDLAVAGYPMAPEAAAGAAEHVA